MKIEILDRVKEPYRPMPPFERVAVYLNSDLRSAAEWIAYEPRYVSPFGGGPPLVARIRRNAVATDDQLIFESEWTDEMGNKTTRQARITPHPAEGPPMTRASAFRFARVCHIPTVNCLF